MFTTQECILMKLLNCGSADLELLEDINYDLNEILEDLMENNDLHINSIFREVFIKGARDLQAAFEENKEDIRQDIIDSMEVFKNELLKEGYSEEDVYITVGYEKLQADLKLIDNLNPVDNLAYDLNYLCTSVYMKNIDFYRKWMSEKVDLIEDNMGWEFECWED